MTFTHVEVRAAYADSVSLLQVSRDVAAVPGVRAAQVAMATPLNLDVIASMGFTLPPTTPHDMVVALRLDDEEALPSALAAVSGALAAAARSSSGPVEVAPPRTVRGAHEVAPDAGLVLVSVPGEHAFVEAMDALESGCDVMVFSDNVPVAQEVALKDAAAHHDLLVMGPDCGTAVIGGVGLGFANAGASAAEPGRVGIVAASGTGCQQVMCLLDAAGVPVDTALGVGGRDLSEAVAGRSTRTALARLDADPDIDHIVVVSKPPAPEVAEEVRRFADGLATPVSYVLLGPGEPDLTAGVESLLTTIGRPLPAWPSWGQARPAGPGRLRGLFVGGTLCDEAMLVAGDALGPIHSNIPLSPDLALDDSLTAAAHLMVDFGDDTLTRGRAHPMIDPTLRLEHLALAAADPRTGVILLDVVLGHGAEPDPAAQLVPAIRAARTGRDLPVVVTCVGTEADPQELSRQATALAGAGAEVHLSNAAATRRAVELVSGGGR